jgi:hypothetical protein
MDVISHQRPSEDSRFRRPSQFANSREKLAPVSLVSEEITPFNSTNHHMMERPRSIQPRLPWHYFTLSQPHNLVKPIILIVNTVDNVPLFSELLRDSVQLGSFPTRVVRRERPSSPAAMERSGIAVRCSVLLYFSLVFLEALQQLPE